MTPLRPTRPSTAKHKPQTTWWLSRRAAAKGAPHAARYTPQASLTSVLLLHRGRVGGPQMLAAKLLDRLLGMQRAGYLPTKVRSSDFVFVFTEPIKVTVLLKKRH
jgi:hypothetical protein